MHGGYIPVVWACGFSDASAMLLFSGRAGLLLGSRALSGLLVFFAGFWSLELVGINDLWLCFLVSLAIASEFFWTFLCWWYIFFMLLYIVFISLNIIASSTGIRRCFLAILERFLFLSDFLSFLPFSEETERWSFFRQRAFFFFLLYNSCTRL